MKIVLDENSLNAIQEQLNLLPIMATAQAQKIVKILNDNVEKEQPKKEQDEKTS